MKFTPGVLGGFRGRQSSLDQAWELHFLTVTCQKYKSRLLKRPCLRAHAVDKGDTSILLQLSALLSAAGH